ncbi:MAG TPA: hypothetical protein VHJ99_10820 [Candidatus Dormibacteraeota bacterium]|nr:hypothetical protein [Candidatus Dormibacteraeota bacterium]
MTGSGLLTRRPKPNRQRCQGPEAHEVRENTVTTAMFFVGFLVLLMVDVLT